MSNGKLSFLAPILGSIGGIEKTAKELKQSCQELEIEYQCISLLQSEQSDFHLHNNAKFMKFFRGLVGTSFTFLLYTFISAIRNPTFWRKIENSNVLIRNSSMCLGVYLAARFKKIDVDIIYLPSHYSLDIHKGVMSSKHKGYIPDIKSFVNMYSEFLIEKFILRSQKIKVVTFSHNLKNRLNKDSIRVIRPGVSREIQEIDIGNEHFHDNDTVNLIYVGRIDRGKNIELMLDLVNNSSVNVNLCLCGDGQLRPLVEHYSNNSDGIRYLGKQFGVELAMQYLSSDYTFLPTFLESYGHVIPESLCLGKPVIGYSFTGCNNAIAELIDNGETGFILRSKDQEEFDRIMKLALDNKPYFYTQKEHIRQEALKRFNWHQFIKSIVE